MLMLSVGFPIISFLKIKNIQRTQFGQKVHHTEGHSSQQSEISDLCST